MKFISNEKQKKIQIETLKSEFAFFGYDISDMTDEEIEDGILRVSELSKKCGVTAQECVEVCRLSFFNSCNLV